MALIAGKSIYRRDGKHKLKERLGIEVVPDDTPLTVIPSLRARKLVEVVS